MSTVPAAVVPAVSVVYISFLAVLAVLGVGSGVVKDKLLSDHCQGVRGLESAVGEDGTTPQMGQLLPRVDTMPGKGLILSMVAVPAKRSSYSERLI